MPTKLRDQLAADPFYGVCARAVEPGHICSGRITWEHSLIYAGKQLQEWWAIVPLCEYYHLGAGLDKKRNRWIALCRAPVVDLEHYGLVQERIYLISKFGQYVSTGRSVATDAGTHGFYCRRPVRNVANSQTHG